MLVVVRTYPDLSEKYDETVCTAAITDRGEWRRLYPVALRYLEQGKQYRTWTIIRVGVSAAKADNRPESRRPDLASIVVEDRTLTEWPARRDWVGASQTFASVEAMKAAGRSIGPVAVQQVKDFHIEPQPADLTPKETANRDQARLWDDRLPLEKMPVKFRVQWVDADGNERTDKFRSWEVCQTWRQWRDRYDEQSLATRMREKWLGDIFGPARDITFCMGNLSQPKLRHVFQITGTFTPPKGPDVDTLF